jgi:hypothetical protein
MEDKAVNLNFMLTKKFLTTSNNSGKMGFKVAPISYCSWNGRLRKGINNITTIHELSKQENFK